LKKYLNGPRCLIRFDGYTPVTAITRAKEGGKEEREKKTPQKKCNLRLRQAPAGRKIKKRRSTKSRSPQLSKKVGTKKANATLRGRCKKKNSKEKSCSLDLHANCDPRMQEKESRDAK